MTPYEKMIRFFQRISKGRDKIVYMVYRDYDTDSERYEVRSVAPRPVYHVGAGIYTPQGERIGSCAVHN